MKQARFYDQDPVVSKAANLVLNLPEEVRTLVAVCLISLSDRRFGALARMGNFKQLESDKVLSIFKAKEKKRTYDRNLAVHKAFNCLLVISETDRQTLSGQVIDMVEVVSAYQRFCALKGSPVNIRLIEALLTTYVKLGSMGANKLFNLVKAKVEVAAAQGGHRQIQEQEARLLDSLPANEKEIATLLPEGGLELLSSLASVKHAEEATIAPTDSAVAEKEDDANKNIMSAVKQIGKELKVKGDII